MKRDTLQRVRLHLLITGRSYTGSHMPTSTNTLTAAVCISAVILSTVKDILSILLIFKLKHFKSSCLLKKIDLEICFLFSWFHIEVNRAQFCLFQALENASAYGLLRLLAALVLRFCADNLPGEVCWCVATQLLRTGELHLSKKHFLVSGDNRPKNGTQCWNNDKTNVECRLMISMTFIWEKIQLFRTKIVH